MRNYTRWRKEAVERPRLNLVRGADGRLRSAGDDDSAAVVIEQKPAAPVQVEPTVERAQAVEEPKSKRKLRLPHISLPTLNFKWISKKHIYVAVAALAVLAIAVTSYGLMDRNGKQPTQSGPQVLDLKSTKGPNFNALLPKGKSIQDLGGWARVSPEDKDPVFAYVDVMGGIQLNVSQQELPAALRTNTAEQVEKLAEAYAANQKIAIDTGTAYLGTSIRGPQSLIFTRNGLLILIKSSSKLTDQQWADYVSSLQ